MPTAEPTKSQFAALANADQHEPFTMVNFLKFRDKVAYEPGSDKPERPGAETYAEYTKVVIPKIDALGGSLTYR